MLQPKLLRVFLVAVICAVSGCATAERVSQTPKQTRPADVYLHLKVPLEWKASFDNDTTVAVKAALMQKLLEAGHSSSGLWLGIGNSFLLGSQCRVTGFSDTGWYIYSKTRNKYKMRGSLATLKRRKTGIWPLLEFETGSMSLQVAEIEVEFVPN